MLDIAKVIADHAQARSMSDDTVGPPNTILLALPVYRMVGLTTLIYGLRVGGHAGAGSASRLESARARSEGGPAASTA